MIEYYLKKSLNEKIIIRIMYDNKGIITEREIRVTSIKDEKIPFDEKKIIGQLASERFGN